jgi:hypothetical protein
MGMKYRHANSNIIYRRIKLVMKDEERGAMTREQAGEALHRLANELVEKKPQPDQLELIDLNNLPERIQEHLKQNRRR